MPSSQVMEKWETDKLHSGSKHGPIVRNRKQAVAIMLSEKQAEASGHGHGSAAVAGLQRAHRAPSHRS